MGYLRGFLPWIAFGIVSNFAWQWAALLAVVLSLFFLVRDRRAGVTADAQILDFGTIFFFALLTAVAFADPHSALQNYESGLSSAWLALIAAVSLLLRQPFTLGIAKRQTPPEIWGTASFRHTSTVLTSVWTTAFALSAAATLILEAAGTGALPKVAVQILGFVVPALFTHHYVRAVRARVAAADATTQSFPAAGR